MRATWRWWNLGFLLLGTVLARPASARQDPPAQPDEPEGTQVLTQGPIHEAFAQPVVFDPKAGPVIAKTPPAPINELPPDQKPEGGNVQWIPGYWAWDDSRNDFIWVSGVWRAIPPGREWVPGYWNPVDGGVQWVPGYWGATQADAAQAGYLPAPPASLEQGPTSPAPSADATWAPGYWMWQNDQYAWRPGFWVTNQPGWMWNPAEYSYTPSGYVFNPGFWDYPLANRGTPFAPVYFNQGITNRPNFLYTPAVGLLTSSLASSLFVRPAYQQYYFGNYYGANNFQNGIYPWYAFHQSRYGYDPLYAYAASQNRSNPQWAQNLHDSYAYRRDHPEARPSGTFAEMRRVAARPAAGAARPAIANDLTLARPFSQIAAAPAAGGNAPAMRYERVEQARRQEMARQSTQLYQFREDRQRRELQALKAAPPAGRTPQPRRIEMPRSPIAATPARAESARVAPPAIPAQPRIDRAIRAPGPGAAPIRHEPGPAVLPPAHQPPVGGPPPGRGRAPEGRRPGQPAPGAVPAPAPGGGAQPKERRPGQGRPDGKGD